MDLSRIVKTVKNTLGLKYWKSKSKIVFVNYIWFVEQVAGFLSSFLLG